MAKLEAYYKGEIVKAIQAAGGYARRIEDQFAVGIPDLLLKLPVTEMTLAEVKRFNGNFFALSPRQYVEGQRIVKAGGFFATVGIDMRDERTFICGLPADKDGKCYAAKCIAQQSGEKLPALFIRWYDDEVERRAAARERTQHVVQRGEDHHDAAGQPARRSRELVPDDRRSVDDAAQASNDTPPRW
jgi:hypothetical protein